MDMDGRRRWSDLPADVLREISRRVCNATDFVHFHAVCKPWHASRDSLSRRTTTTQFLPWLLSPTVKESTQLSFRCVFSKASYHAASALPVPWTNWVCNADGTAIWYLIVKNLCPSLHNPLTGQVTHLPLFLENQWGQQNPRGILYNDGTTFLYIISYLVGGICRFRATLHRPQEAKWIVVERTFRGPEYSAFCAAYHGGKIMFTVDGVLWRCITPDGDDMFVPQLRSPRWDHGYYKPQYSYVLESRGELLWVLVQVQISFYTPYRGGCAIRREISLSVHALEHNGSAPQKNMSWVKKKGRSLADRVLFLGWPNSFAVDTTRLGENGGCAYFVYYDSKALPREQVGVFKYDLITNKAEFVERLPQGWANERCTWHVPQPTIAPIKELCDSAIKLQKHKQKGPLQTTPVTSPACIMTHYKPSLRLLVRDLPPSEWQSVERRGTLL